VYTGISKLTHFGGTSHMIAEKGIPLAAVATAIAILIELGGAFAIIIGWQTKLAAAIQFVYLIFITVAYHNFWAAPPQLHDMQLINFMKNVGIMGGLLLLATRGAGASAVDSAPARG
jgi:putative oxidoreductase